MKRFMNKKVAAIGVAAGLVLGGAGAAFAYFTSTGQGSGSASVGTNTAWAVAQGATDSGPLTPGGPTETIHFTVTNNSTGYQQLSQVSVQVAGSTGASPTATPTVYSYTGNVPADPACTASDFSVGGEAAGTTHVITGINDDLAPSGVYHGSITVQMVNRDDTVPGDNSGNQDNCESQNPPLFYSAS